MQGSATHTAALPGSLDPAALRARVTAAMRECLAPYDGGVYGLVAYHLGWRDEHGAPAERAAGKLLRPLLCLTAAEGYAGSERALSAAVAVELLHAFSLVHDDIEDGDRERRHRPTLWALRGVPLAINAGDSLFALAHRALTDGAMLLPPERAAAALRAFSDACLRMIEGQHMDLEFEAMPSVGLNAYLRMTAGKTGALLGASLALGALFAGAPLAEADALRDAGRDAGIAFQAVDDALAVWGDPAATGKPVGNDAARGKKSLPAVIAAGRGLPPEHPDVRAETMRVAAEHAERARAAVRTTSIRGDAAAALDGLIAGMLAREG